MFPLKCEIDNRVFPISDDGTEIVEAFENIFAKYRNKITLHYWEEVDSISHSDFFSESTHTLWDNETYSGLQKAYWITTKKWVYDPDIVVITTGWNAYSHTGSTGDGYAFARSLGHTVTQLGPSLSSWLTSEKWTHELSGLAFESAKIGELQWALLLTHFGISGPLAFMTSSKFAWETIDKNHIKVIYFTPVSSMGYMEWNYFLKSNLRIIPKNWLPVFSLRNFPGDLQKHLFKSILLVSSQHIRYLSENEIEKKYLDFSEMVFRWLL